ncbi:LysR family transcriptional regulator [Chengkuizengella marina]|uniref:LysR family transcriptional regulator n=1 Tax=Chengkuizengella marina TaxID=2507566 RepID=A0A6N9Q0E8_9BACL|nr:LysR family transcriptional regulator [Chengkuizengella marina]NBI28385.1 LysR family transcriptional regulator [Chengkuizengella marina]
MTYLQLEILMKVIELGSFTRAAKFLHLTQPNISHAISGLEEELGFTLLMRGRNGVYLTDIGKRLFPYIQNSLDHFEILKQEVATIKELKVGTLKIGYFPTCPTNLVSKIIRAFNNLYPGIEVDIQQGSSEEINHWLESGIIDTGFVILPSKDFDTVPLITDHLSAFLPTTHPLASESIVCAEQLSFESIIMPKGGCEVYIKDFFNISDLDVDIKIDVSDINTILSLVQEEMGITILPKMVLPQNLIGIQAVPLSPQIQIEIGLAVRSFKNMSPAVKIFIEEVSSNISLFKCSKFIEFLKQTLNQNENFSK